MSPQRTVSQKSKRQPPLEERRQINSMGPRRERVRGRRQRATAGSLRTITRLESADDTSTSSDSRRRSASKRTATSALLLAVAAFIFLTTDLNHTNRTLRQVRRALSAQDTSLALNSTQVDASTTTTYSITDEQMQALSKQRILLYLPTHLSQLHIDSFTKIWPGLISRSPLLQNVDVLFFIPETKNSTLQQLLHSTPLFAPNQNVTTATYQEYVGTGLDLAQDGIAKHQGDAKVAITLGFQRGYFSSYDWVLRVNPDTLLLNDEQLIQTMLDESAGALLVDCQDRNNEYWVVHTDFTLWKPSLTPRGDDGVDRSNMAEIHMRDVLLPVTNLHKARVLHGNQRNEGHCRVYGKESPVIHHHGYAEGLIGCFDRYKQKTTMGVRSISLKCLDEVDREIADHREE